jgi:hypothetical protein
MVKIKMDAFVKKYQPELYDFWRLGIDNSLIESVDNSSKRRNLPIIGSLPLKFSQNEENPKSEIQNYLNKISDHYSHVQVDNILNKSPSNLSLGLILPDYLMYALNKDLQTSLANATRKVSFEILKRLDQNFSASSSIVKHEGENNSNHSQDESQIEIEHTLSSPLVISDLIDVPCARSDDSEENGYMNAADYNQKVQLQYLKCENGK